MAKIPKKLVNFRLPMKTVEFIVEAAEAMQTSQSEVVEQAITLFESMQNGAPLPVMHRDPPDVESDVPTRNELQEMIGLVQGKPAGIAAVAGKYLRPDGKPMNFFEKREVDRREAIAAKAATDEAAVMTGRDDIDYEAFND